MAFWSFGSEISTEPLLATLHARGVTICLPRIEDGNLVPRSYTPGDATTTTSFGAREPTATAAPVDPTTIDVVVTPGLAFDRRCRRVGYGGGFFDRFFGHMAPGAFRAGVAFSLQVLDEQLPAGPSDVPVHAVVTEREVVRCAGGGDAT
jgi:5-formyltetrahydrofolate cyclo-ligase